MNEHQRIQKRIQQWLEELVIGLNLCPFAFKVVQQNTLRYHICDSKATEEILKHLAQEFHILDQDKTVSTSLLVIPNAFESFYDFLDLIDLANELLLTLNYEGVYQLAHFHPKYTFADTLAHEAENYTNRSPYPCLHLIREDEMEKVLENYPNPESIPENNIAKMNEVGSEKLRLFLQSLMTEE